MRRFHLAIAAFSIACADRDLAPSIATDEPRDVPCAAPFAPTDNPLDAELAKKMQSACLVAVPEEPAILCRRLMTDLLGRFPNEEEIATRCLGRRYEDVVRELQQDRRYLLVAERIWASVLYVQDFFSEAERVLDFFADVRALHRSDITYREFAMRVSTKPDIVFNSLTDFLDYAYTTQEYDDFSRLRALYERVLVPDRQLPFVLSVEKVVIDPKKCVEIGGCKTTLFGGGEIALSETGTIALADASPELLAKLQIPGALIASTPRFYEAAAERILNHYLDWNDGGVFPRTPGSRRKAK